MRNSIWTTARKELRAYFLSPVALIFLGVFLVATLFIFFTQARFFARNLADVRPLFNWLPILLIFLVGAVTMRQWSEEQKMGTLEVLLTLPLRTRDLVLGKFLAGMMLVGVALLLTFPLPITVSMLGELDWGPVIGGYVAALLLASTYMAIGLCVSARTDNQIVALMLTCVIGAVLYMVGAQSIVAFFGNDTGEWLRQLGTGSRFESIERGVLDVRDFAYYCSLTVFFLVLNVHFLEMKRVDRNAASGRGRALVLLTTVLLVGLNVVAANFVLAPVTALRADLTRDGEYSVSDVTARVIGGLSEQLTITGYFSKKTHPLLAPLVPRIRDFLKEYEILGDGKVVVEFVDPNQDEDLEEEIGQQYGIRSVPFRVSERQSEAVVNSYFHLLIRYGDEHEVLSFQDLIEVHADQSDVAVRLRNLELDVTRAIKKVSQEFQSIDAVLARLEGTAKLTAYISPDKLPEEFKEVPERLKKVVDELVEKAGDKFVFNEIDPLADESLQLQLQQRYGFRPMALDLLGGDRFYLYLLFEAGGQVTPIFPQGQMSEADIRGAVESAIKRATPGFTKTIAIHSFEEKQPQQPMIPGMPQPPRKPPNYRTLAERFKADYAVERLDLKDGYVPANVDVLLVAEPGEWNAKQQFAVDQYLMRGGALIVMAGANRVEPGRQGIETKPTNKALLDMLKAWGVSVEDAFVLDPRNAPFPVPVSEQRGPFVMQRIELMPYPWFPDVRQDGFKQGHLALAGLNNLVLTWASPLKVVEGLDEVKAEVIVQSSPDSWVRANTSVQPVMAEMERHPQTAGIAPGEERGRRPLAIVATGRFKSYFAEKANPLWGGKEAGENADATGRTLKASSPEARLVVIGSSAFASDLVAQLGQQFGGGLYRGNMPFVHNLVDWALADTDLLEITGTGAFARTLRPMEDGERTRYELTNYAVVLAALGIVVFIATTRRRRTQSLLEEGSA